MKVTSISDFRRSLKQFFDDVDCNQEPLIVTRSDNVSVVVLPLKTYSSYTETDYLQRSPVNASRLRTSIQKAQAGHVKHYKLLEE